MKNAILVSGCPGEERGWNTQLLYFTGSSLSRDDKSLFLISDRNGSPNVIVRDLATGTERTLTQNRNGVMKSYVYFDCNPGKGLSKASVCLDAAVTSRFTAWTPDHKKHPHVQGCVV